ncbi:ABC transporter ATP-binding protein [Cryomorpha ignava]|uniref:ABC transporter ATP-binding protein n=1 Tax=Cryomorpha ignava TaxID=101383 RepID=UPI0019545DE6|nr:ATP-binding cassette domain-containing protein [Cryomorpha ignava]
MIEIELKNVGKRFNRDWIFRNWSATLNPESAYVVLGGNGSGKSTALRVLLGYAPQSEGELLFRIDGKKIDQNQVYKHFSFCSPYLELYEELTLDEMAKFHFSLKPLLPQMDLAHFAEYVHLEASRNKPVKYFSSGMKQRLRLGLALYSDTKGVFLDEPISNLDRFGIDWYRNVVQELRKDRLLIVASNKQTDEYFFCDQKINIEDFKHR